MVVALLASLHFPTLGFFCFIHSSVWASVFERNLSSLALGCAELEWQKGLVLVSSFSEH